MQRVNSLQGKWQNTVFFLIALLVVAADQLSKTWIMSNLPEGRSLFETGFFRITHVHNTGAAFGLFPDQSFALAIIALISITAIIVYVFVIYRYFPLPRMMLGKVALGLVFGGTLGNLIDRFCFGYVTDFIDFGFWPAFNIADSAVSVGVIIFAYSLLRLARAEKR